MFSQERLDRRPVDPKGRFRRFVPLQLEQLDSMLAECTRCPLEDVELKTLDIHFHTGDGALSDQCIDSHHIHFAHARWVDPVH